MFNFVFGMYNCAYYVDDVLMLPCFARTCMGFNNIRLFAHHVVTSLFFGGMHINQLFLYLCRLKVVAVFM